VLEPGGRFVAELGGTGNVSAIVDAVFTELERRGYEQSDPWYFPSIGEYAPRLEAHGFEVQYATLFDRPTELDDGEDGLASWLEMFGDSLLSQCRRRNWTTSSPPSRTNSGPTTSKAASGPRTTDGFASSP